MKCDSCNVKSSGQNYNNKVHTPFQGPGYEFWSFGHNSIFHSFDLWNIQRLPRPNYSYKTSRLDFISIIQPGSQLLVYIVIIFSISYTTIVLQRNASEKLKDIILKGGILDQLRSLVRRKFLKEALGDERWERDILPVFLHLLLGVLGTLEGEVLEPGQHPSSGVHSAHQLVGGAQADSEGEVLGVVLSPQSRDEASGALEPAHYLQTSLSGQLRV